VLGGAWDVVFKTREDEMRLVLSIIVLASMISVSTGQQEPYFTDPVARQKAQEMGQLKLIFNENRSHSAVLRGVGIELMKSCHPDLRKYAKTAPVKCGAIVGRMDPKSPGSNAGLMEYDVIHSVESTTIKGYLDLLRWRNGIPKDGGKYAFHILRLLPAKMKGGTRKWEKKDVYVTVGPYPLTMWENETYNSSPVFFLEKPLPKREFRVGMR
jgi:hypothetical protein